MPRPRTISDEEILEAARACFQEHGHSVSTREIARAAGISQAVLYQRFGGKHELFISAMLPRLADPGTLLPLYTGGQDVSDYLVELLGTMYGILEEVLPRVIHLMAYPDFDLSEMDAHHDHALAQPMTSALRARIEDLQHQGVLDEGFRAEVLAFTLIAVVHGVAMHALMGFEHHDSGERHARWRQIVEMICRGLEP